MLRFFTTMLQAQISLKDDTENRELSRTIASTATLKIAKLPASNLLYTPIEERFERITRLARRTLDVPVAAVTLINDDKQWFKSVSGWTVTELPRHQSLCRKTLQNDRLTVVEDTASDPDLAGLPVVTGRPNFRFYAGIPLYDADRSTIGTFCVLDVKPRRFSSFDIQGLSDLAALAQNELYADHLSSVHSALTSKLSMARREAMMDPLTRLWNRRGAMVMLKAAFEEADRLRAPVGIALLDLDNFKRINDTYGHQIGDEVLRRMGTRLISSVRGEDLTCRIGGDEFLLIMAESDQTMSAKIAERVRRAITDTAIQTRQGAMPMSISVGYTVREPGESLTLEQLLERADRGLMQSKSDGRNRVRSA